MSIAHETRREAFEAVDASYWHWQAYRAVRAMGDGTAEEIVAWLNREARANDPSKGDICDTGTIRPRCTELSRHTYKHNDVLMRLRVAGKRPTGKRNRKTGKRSNCAVYEIMTIGADGQRSLF